MLGHAWFYDLAHNDRRQDLLGNGHFFDRGILVGLQLVEVYSAPTELADVLVHIFYRYAAPLAGLQAFPE